MMVGFASMVKITALTALVGCFATNSVYAASDKEESTKPRNEVKQPGPPGGPILFYGRNIKVPQSSNSNGRAKRLKDQKYNPKRN